MKTLTKALTLFVLFFALASCREKETSYKAKLDIKPQPYDLEFDRYEEVLFNLDTADFQNELKQIQEDYRVFLSGDLDNLEEVQYLRDFAVNPFSIALYHKVKVAFPDLREVEPLVEDVLAHFHYYYPDMELPKKAYTCVTGINFDEPPVQIIDGKLVISLDWYLGGDEIYDQIGMPRYLSLRRHLATLAKDVAEVLYMDYLYEDRKQGQVIDEMVYIGKLDFFIEALCPMMPDSVLLGYSSKQWQWAVDNEGQVWADIVGNQLLYDPRPETYRMLLWEGPCTQAYGQESPSRLGEFYGLNIIRSYFSNNEISIQDLLKEKDLQGVFQKSKYKPKK